MKKSNNFCCAHCGSDSDISKEFRLHGSLSIMRHGRTKMNDQHIIIGSIDDPLCERGRKQATDKAEELRSAGERFDRIVTSPYSRAFETANIVGTAMNTMIMSDARLRERCVGIYEGKLEFHGLHTLFLGDVLIENAETIESLNERTKSILDDVVREYECHVLFVTHALPFLKLIQHIKGWSIKELLAYCPPENCEVIKFYITSPCLHCGRRFIEQVIQ